MQKGLIEFKWEYIDEYSDEDITYFLFLEGKSIEAISKIRNSDKSRIQKQIINGKIKYRYFIKNNSIDEFFHALTTADKFDRDLIIQNLNVVNKKKLIQYINDRYADFSPKEKQKAVWIVGELKEITALKVLVKASVNKMVNIRRMAISAMNKLNNTQCEDYLIRALYDENPQVALYALKGLQKLESKKALTHIRKLENQWQKDYLIREKENFLKIIDVKGD